MNKHIEARVVSVATEERVTDVLKTKDGLEYNPFFKTHKRDKYLLLYVISDDEIKEGDWVYYKNGRDTSLFRVTKVDKTGRIYEGITAYPSHDCKKIIATSDDSLKLYESETIASAPGFKLKTEDIVIPPIPQAFIREYCEKGGIEDVLVEVEEIWEPNDYNQSDTCVGERLYLINGSIRVKEYVKETWDRKEVEQLINSFADAHGINWLDSRTQKWIKENL